MTNFIAAQYDRLGQQIFDPNALARSNSVFTTPPAIPQNVLAIAGDKFIQVRFRAAARADYYTVTLSPSGATAQGSWSLEGIQVVGVTNGVTQIATVTASNSSGTSLVSSVSNSVTPAAISSFARLRTARGLMCWRAASQMPVVANGTAIASALDYSGNGYAAAQSNAGLRPTYVTAANWASGGTTKPAIKYANDNQQLLSLLSPKLLGNKFTIYLVISFTGLTAGSGARDMRILTTENSRYDGSWYVGTSTAGVGGGGTTCVKVSITGDNSNSSSPVVAINTVYIISIVAGRQFFVDGVRASIASASGITPELTLKPSGLSVGGCGDLAGLQNFNGCVAEEIYCNVQHTDAERWAVEAGLATEYSKAAPAQQATLS